MDNVNKRRRRMVLAVLTGVVGVACVVAIGLRSFIRTTEANLEQLKSLPMADVDMSRVADGTYYGSYSMFPVSARVKVTVRDHRISEIELVEHRHGRGAAAEAIPGRVVDAQSLDVDTVAGATYSSKVILKAIENALTTAGR
ncbi:MAG: FMN-binding protein [Firmicutes bacterium]|jgi:uncharacterized protein with FMN-binding domain|nr:FMN-binding protein [Bacillota bacterium]MDH7494689.1 FMN-binding protein [Bacillota bacterium]